MNNKATNNIETLTREDAKSAHPKKKKKTKKKKKIVPLRRLGTRERIGQLPFFSLSSIMSAE